MDALTQLARQKILEKMTDEERFMYLMMTEQERSSRQIRDDLQEIQRGVERNKYSFKTDLFANISGNVITDTAIYLLSLLSKRIKLF